MISLIHTSDSGNQQAEASIQSLLFFASYNSYRKSYFWLSRERHTNIQKAALLRIHSHLMSDDELVL
jgi:hypothetical protein